jgi:hypothetical protein
MVYYWTTDGTIHFLIDFFEVQISVKKFNLEETLSIFPSLSFRPLLQKTVMTKIAYKRIGYAGLFDKEEQNAKPAKTGNPLEKLNS